MSMKFPLLIIRKHPSKLNCPECGIRMALYSCRDAIVDKCPSCEGIWFEKSELGIFVDALRDFDLTKIEIVTDTVSNPPVNSAHSLKLCPSCNNLLVSFKYQYNSKVTLDRCSECEGIWAPGGQVLSLVSLVKFSKSIENHVKAMAHGIKELHDSRQNWKAVKDLGKTAAQSASFSMKLHATVFRVLPILPLADSNPTSRFPWITTLLIIANVLIFFFGNSGWIQSYAFVSNDLRHDEKLITLVTYGFLHGGVFHLLGNMWFLWIFGDNIEDKLGGLTYSLFYLVCGTFGSLVYFAVNSRSSVPLIGASGAISGLLGAYLIFYPAHKIYTRIAWNIIGLPAAFYLGFWALLQVLYSLFGAIGLGQSIAWSAHIGGFMAGLMFALVFKLDASRE